MDDVTGWWPLNEWPSNGSLRRSRTDGGTDAG